jgi:hypothetical protein
MIKIILIIVAIGLLLFLIDRFCLWLESKDLLYYRHKKPPTRIIGNGLQELQGILNPGSCHVIEIKQNQAQNKRHKENALADDNYEKHDAK